MTQREKISLQCLRPAKNLQHRREKKKRPAVRGQHTHRETRLVSVQKLCTAKQVQREAETTQGRERIRQFMFAVALQMQHKTFWHTCMTCLQINSAPQWTLYNIVFHGARFTAQRQLMSYLTRISARCISRILVNCTDHHHIIHYTLSLHSRSNTL